MHINPTYFFSEVSRSLVISQLTAYIFDILYLSLCFITCWMPSFIEWALSDWKAYLLHLLSLLQEIVSDYHTDDWFLCDSYTGRTQGNNFFSSEKYMSMKLSKIYFCWNLKFFVTKTFLKTLYLNLAWQYTCRDLAVFTTIFLLFRIVTGIRWLINISSGYMKKYTSSIMCSFVNIGHNYLEYLVKSLQDVWSCMINELFSLNCLPRECNFKKDTNHSITKC